MSTEAEFWIRAQERLTVKQWQVIKMRYVFEMRWTDIADGLDISVQAAQARARGGLRRLREIERRAA